MDIRIDRVLKLAKPLRLLWKTVEDFDKLVASYERSVENMDLSSDNKTIVRSEAIAMAYRHLVDKLIRRDENWWINESGYNLFDIGSHQKALDFFDRQIDHFDDLHEGFSGMVLLLRTTRVTDNMNLKGLANMAAPSLVAIQELHRVRVMEEYTVLQKKVRKIQALLRKIREELEIRWTLK